jgi:hypothetical protein
MLAAGSIPVWFGEDDRSGALHVAVPVGANGLSSQTDDGVVTALVEAAGSISAARVSS